MAREGARAFLFEHTEPYSGTVASLTQELVYGRIANKGENPYFLTIPFFLLPFYFPISLISENAVAHGIWMFLDEVALFGMALLCLQVIGWRPSRFLLISYSLVSFFSYYSVAALLEGTPVILLGLVYLAILFTYLIGQDEMTGMLLVLTLFNWEVGSLFLLLILWKIFIDKVLLIYKILAVMIF